MSKIYISFSFLSATQERAESKTDKPRKVMVKWQQYKYKHLFSKMGVSESSFLLSSQFTGCVKISKIGWLFDARLMAP